MGHAGAARFLDSSADCIATLNDVDVPLISDFINARFGRLLASLALGWRGWPTPAHGREPRFTIFTENGRWTDERWANGSYAGPLLLAAPGQERAVEPH